MEVVQRSRNKKSVIPLLKIFTYKRDNMTNTIKCKVRIGFAGCCRRRFKPNCKCRRIQSVPDDQLTVPRIYMSINVSTAVLYGRLETPIFIELPSGHPKRDLNRNLRFV